jgi:hypothetical protein
MQLSFKDFQSLFNLPLGQLQRERHCLGRGRGVSNEEQRENAINRRQSSTTFAFGAWFRAKTGSSSSSFTSASPWRTSSSRAKNQ